MPEFNRRIVKIAENNVVEIEDQYNAAGELVRSVELTHWGQDGINDARPIAIAKRDDANRPDFATRERNKRQAEVDRLDAIQAVMDGPVSP